MRDLDKRSRVSLQSDQLFQLRNVVGEDDVAPAFGGERLQRGNRVLENLPFVEPQLGDVMDLDSEHATHLYELKIGPKWVHIGATRLWKAVEAEAME